MHTEGVGGHQPDFGEDGEGGVGVVTGCQAYIRRPGDEWMGWGGVRLYWGLL